jgi:hypothetical protein
MRLLRWIIFVVGVTSSLAYAGDSELEAAIELKHRSPGFVMGEYMSEGKDYYRPMDIEST